MSVIRTKQVPSGFTEIQSACRRGQAALQNARPRMDGGGSGFLCRAAGSQAYGRWEVCEPIRWSH